MIWPIKRDQLAKCSERDFNESRNATVVAFFSGWVIFQRPMFYGLNNRTRISRQIFDSKTNSSFFAQPSLLPFFYAGDVTSGQMTFYPFCFAPSFSVVHTFLRWKSSEFAVCEGPLLKPHTTDKKEKNSSQWDSKSRHSWLLVAVFFTSVRNLLLVKLEIPIGQDTWRSAIWTVACTRLKSLLNFR